MFALTERPTDKNIWKWGHSSTPEYLERRNQYRRSEMRYRSKKGRKAAQASKSLDEGFLTKTVDENLLSSRVGSVDHLEESKPKCPHTDKKCNCHPVRIELNEKLQEDRSNTQENNIDGDNDVYIQIKSTRSKSEPRITSGIYKSQSLNRNDDLSIKTNQKKFATLRPTSGEKTEEEFEIKVYSKKIMPKRIANLKKKRAKSMKETSKFYTELKITESTDDLTIEIKNNDQLPNKIEEKITLNEVKQNEQNDVIDCRNKKDADIISELLKANKDFDKILSKPPKKKSIDNGRMTSSVESIKSQRESESEFDCKTNDPAEMFPITTQKFELLLEQKRAITRLNKIQNELNTPEPIYEQLKRNVHVPYKYCPSPLLTRSKSQPYPGTPKPKKQERPESDYVTLDFTAVLPNYNPVINDFSQLRNSDSNINYSKISEKNNSNESIKTSPDLTFERHESFNTKHTKNILNRFMSVRQDDTSTKCNSENHLILNVKLPQRRVSDVTELCRKSVIYKQGSENLGSRIAHIDYADPKTLFPVAATNNILINKHSLKPQRDSAFSLTSSSDSVCDSKTPPAIHSKSEPEYPTKSIDDSFYEDKVEECLENDGFFRDSAVYSDDNNERKYDYSDDRPKIKVPPLVPRKPKLAPQSPPPPLPAKPPRIICSNIINYNSNSTSMDHASPPTSLSGRGNANTNGNQVDRSWVLKQIKNFNK